MIFTIGSHSRLRKDNRSDGFGGPNMWQLQILNRFGGWSDTQWMGAGNAQLLLEEKLPVFKEPDTVEFGD